MIFDDREQAGRLLAEKLSHLRGTRPLVLAVPRGALPMGQIVANQLDGELDVVLVHKLGHPFNPELAIGSVSETGEVALQEHARELGVSQEYVDQEADRQLETLRERRRRFTPGREAASARGRTVIVIDDGVATGATLLAALKLVREQEPEKLVAAIGVAPASALARLREIADEVVCLHSPREFFAVGEFFRDFGQVTDRDVIEILRQERGEVPSERGDGT